MNGQSILTMIQLSPGEAGWLEIRSVPGSQNNYSDIHVVYIVQIVHVLKYNFVNKISAFKFI